MGFVDNLRMAGIYGPSGGNFSGGGPDFNMGGGMDPMSIIGTIAALRKQQADDEMSRQQNMISFQRRNAMQDQTFAKRQAELQPQKPMDVAPPRYPDENKDKLTEFQKAQIANETGKLDLAKQSLKTKDENSDQDRALKAQNNTATNAVRQQRADTYTFAQTHKNAQIMAPKGGNYMLYDPVTKELHDSGVSTGTMTQEKFQEMAQSGRETITGMQGENQANTQNIRNQGALADIAARTAGQQQLQNNRPTPYANASQERTGNWNKAQQLMNTRKDLSPFIQAGTNGQFTIIPPKEGYFGGAANGTPTQDQYDEINKFIYGDTKKPTDTKKPADKPVTTPGQDSRYKMSIGDK